MYSSIKVSTFSHVSIMQETFLSILSKLDATQKGTGYIAYKIYSVLYVMVSSALGTKSNYCRDLYILYVSLLNTAAHQGPGELWRGFGLGAGAASQSTDVTVATQECLPRTTPSPRHHPLSPVFPMTAAEIF